MQVTEPEEAQRHAVLYQATIAHAVRGAPDLMARLLSRVRAALRDLASQAQAPQERDRLTASRRALNLCEAEACARFGEELEAAFARTASRGEALSVEPVPRLADPIAGMDAAQVNQSVEKARICHAVQIAADQALVELHALMCQLLGLNQAQLERNPLGPAVFVDAVVAVLGQLPAAAAERHSWLPLISGALGQELELYYRQLCLDLREQGVGAIPPITQPGAADGQPGQPAQPGRAPTFERLRTLLGRTPARRALETSDQYHPASQLSPLDASDTIAPGSPAAFQATVPAAFEMARDMQRLEQVTRRLESSASDVGAQADHPVRAQLRQQAHGLDQSLALEVVALMVDNIRGDVRLLAPVRELVASLEPALLRLALVDPQFFSHKQHPARRLLHEITHRSMAFESQDSRGFSGFMEPLHDAIAPLADGATGGVDRFDGALARLMAVWEAPSSREQQHIAKAVRVLQQAEQRAALAATILREVLQRPDAVLVPSVVLDFLCGPWAQVIAHARMADRTGADDPGQFAALIDSLMWSAQPALAGEDIPALRALLPVLQERLQHGLASIDYPPSQSAGFYQALAQLHSSVLEPKTFADTEMLPAGALEPSGMTAWGDSASAWLAPQEAQASGFIDIPTEPEHGAGIAQGTTLKPDTWFALMTDGQWIRTRLAWVSTNGSLLLFSDALGAVLSLSRRSCEQLIASSHLHAIASDPVEDALDAVARTALRNTS